MKFTITEPIFAMFPEAAVGGVVAHGLDNYGDNAELIALLKEQQQEARASLSGTPLNEHPAITAWRQAYARFGAKPKKYRSSIESLLARVSSGHEIANINTLVNLYNAVSLQYALPVGGEDLDCVRGDIRLTVAGENEPMIRLLGEAEERAPKPGEVIYTDEVGAICRRWNWREAERTKLTQQTRNAILVVEAINLAQHASLAAATSRLAELTQRYCQGSVNGVVLTADNRSLQMD
jgi:DNA/RNA-binding domain of Phe-tRNA-synthetase-like protein